MANPTADIRDEAPLGAMVAVPDSREERAAIRVTVAEYVAAHALVPPLSFEELSEHAAHVLQTSQIAAQYRNFITVLIGNAVWQDTIASIPVERRILLLPQCLRSKLHCPAALDELGLLCEQCGACTIGELQSEAEDLGYLVLVAEGTTVVTRLLESGKVDAVIGVSCLSVLERAFPHMAADAIPGLAIPLCRAGCEDTQLDVDWLREAVHLRSADCWRMPMDLQVLRERVEQWFQSDALREMLQPGSTMSEEIMLAWIGGEGKRWRPFLAACVFDALTDGGPPGTLRKVAGAVECFHKASLIHDDIEDNDDLRYGKQTLHTQYGVPVALNVGDLLLGEGYRLIGECGAPPELIARMLEAAVNGHRTLCIGQGEELCWMRNPQPLTFRQVADIFRQKTAPAFSVALSLGAIAAGADHELCTVLHSFSESLGIAYQLRDDLADFQEASEASDDSSARRPSALFALLYEHATGDQQEKIARIWIGTDANDLEFVRSTIKQHHVVEKVGQLLEHYKNEAYRSLNPLRDATLKTLLRRVTARILK